MNKSAILIGVTLVVASLVAIPMTASACGWRFTCETKEWANDEVGGFLLCLATYDGADIGVPRCDLPQLN